MNGSDDFYASIAELCHISSSQEEILNCCRFTGEPEREENEESFISDENDESTPIESSAIMIISPPESQEAEISQNDDNIPRDSDVFHTPPEGSSLPASQELHQRLSDDQDVQTPEEDCGADDLVRDAESTEEELTQTIEIDSGEYCNESEEFRVMKSNLDVEIIDDSNLGLKTPEAAIEKLERVVKSMEKLKSPLVKKSTVFDGSSRDGDSFAKKKLEYCSRGGVENDRERVLEESLSEKRKEREVNKSIDDIDKFRYVGSLSSSENPLEKKRDFGTRRVLPESLLVNNNGFKDAEMVCDDVEARSLLLGLKSLEERNVREECAVQMSSDVNHNDNAEVEMVHDDVQEGAPSGSISSEGTDVGTKCELPASKCVDDDNNKDDDFEEVPITLLEVLKMLSGEDSYDPELENLSIVEVAERRGIFFP